MSYSLVAASERVRIPVGMVWGLLLVGDWFQVSLLYFIHIYELEGQHKS